MRRPVSNIWIAVAFGLVALGMVSAATAMERVALVIGNSRYDQMRFLPNAGNDAK